MLERGRTGRTERLYRASDSVYPSSANVSLSSSSSNRPSQSQGLSCLPVTEEAQILSAEQSAENKPFTPSPLPFDATSLLSQSLRHDRRPIKEEPGRIGTSDVTKAINPFNLASVIGSSTVQPHSDYFLEHPVHSPQGPSRGRRRDAVICSTSKRRVVPDSAF